MQNVFQKLSESEVLSQPKFKWLFTGLAVSVVSYMLINRKINGYFFTRSASLSSAEKSSVKGKTVVITGGNSGLGLASAIEFAKLGARVLVTVRSEQKGQSTQAAVQQACGKQIEYAIVDCADMDSVSEFAKNLETSGDLRSIILNAGIATETGSDMKEYSSSKDSVKFTQTFAVNYLSHWLMTSLLTNQIIAATQQGNPVSVVSVSSGAHESAVITPEDLTPVATESCSYGQSKLLQILHMKEMQRRLDDSKVTCTAVTPGFASTSILGKATESRPIWVRVLVGLFTALFGRSSKQGCQVIIQAALSEDAKGGGYYSNTFEKPPQYAKKHISDEEWQKYSELAWISTEQLLQQAGIEC